VTDIKQNNKMDTLEYIKEAHNHQKSKVCGMNKCKQHNPQPLSDFSKDKYRKDGLNYQCNSCQKECSPVEKVGLK
jgi:hypothetical protein